MTANSIFRKDDKTSILERVIQNKSGEVKALRPVRRLKRKRRPPVSLTKVLGRRGPGFIFECKKASPAKGDIKPMVDLKALTGTYGRFADAVSVLTDRTFFKGSNRDLETIGQMTDLPLLAKDFFIDEKQIHHAWVAGADAILLMLSVLDDDAYRHLERVAKDHSMEVLTEVHNKAEMKRAKALGAKLIGINNRNLKTLKVNLKTTEQLAPLAPRGAVLISESGFSNRSQILKISPRVNGFLIGSSLMKAKNPEMKARELVFGKVKICGLTNEKDAKMAYNLGASYGGLNFVDGTPRAIAVGTAKKIMASAPLMWVGVFRNATPHYIAAVANYLKLRAVQLHGAENTRFRKKLQRLLAPGMEIWQAVEGAKFKPSKAPKKCHRVLLDSKKFQVFGGTGFSFGWGKLKRLKQKNCLILAGGIDVGKIPKAIKTGLPVLDICSGVETRKGKKSPEKMENLFRAIRTYEGRKR